MIDAKILKRAMLVGVVFRLLLWWSPAHFSPFAAAHFLLFGCMMIAGVAGLLYARDLARGFGLGALGGGVSGRRAASPRWPLPMCWATGPTSPSPMA